jgi:hypothetical protein
MLLFCIWLGYFCLTIRNNKDYKRLQPIIMYLTLLGTTCGFASLIVLPRYPSQAVSGAAVLLVHSSAYFSLSGLTIQLHRLTKIFLFKFPRVVKYANFRVLTKYSLAGYIISTAPIVAWICTNKTQPAIIWTVLAFHGCFIVTSGVFLYRLR